MSALRAIRYTPSLRPVQRSLLFSTSARIMGHKSLTEAIKEDHQEVSDSVVNWIGMDLRMD